MASLPPDAGLDVAAVDLGSNSFHMVIARQTGHDLEILDRLRDPVRLAEGLNEEGRLTDEAQERALASLERFGERLREIPTSRVRAVGTNTLRLARRSPEFRSSARRALGHRIEVISGIEEARLIYLGVAHALPATGESRLVVDIGGGSTELICGAGFEVGFGASLHMGCVGFTERFFTGGAITRDRFREAQTAAAVELQAVRERFRATGWDDAWGASGTINAISSLLRETGETDGLVTHPAMKRLRKMMVAAGHADGLALPGLKAERAQVLAGGLAILLSVFKNLRIASMRPTPGALREGVLYDLLGRIEHEDVRDRTIARLVEQYRIDQAQADRVLETARGLMAQVATVWELQSGEFERTLHWAARLHEIGLAVSHSGHHKHGAYLIANSDLPGFSRDDQVILGALVRGQRRKLRPEIFDEVPADQVDSTLRLCVLLRLAALLNRSRGPVPVPRLEAGPDVRHLTLTFPDGGSADRPLTLADLAQEVKLLSGVGIGLVVNAEG